MYETRPGMTVADLQLQHFDAEADESLGLIASTRPSPVYKVRPYLYLK